MRTFRSLIVFTTAIVLTGCGNGGSGRFGTVSSLKGKGEAYIAAKKTWVDLVPGLNINPADSVRTFPRAEAVVEFDGNSIKLGENTTIGFGDSTDASGARIRTVYNASGEILSNVGRLKGTGARFIIRTPTAAAVVRGTHFFVSYAPATRLTCVKVLDGTVQVNNPAVPEPPVVLTPGCMTTVAMAVPPAPAAPMPYGQFKRLEPMLGDEYHDYVVRFKIKPAELDEAAPIVVVAGAPVVAVTVPVPPPGAHLVVTPPGHANVTVRVPAPPVPSVNIRVHGPAVVPVPVPGAIPHPHGARIVPVPPPPVPGIPHPPKKKHGN